MNPLGVYPLYRFTLFIRYPRGQSHIDSGYPLNPQFIFPKAESQRLREPENERKSIKSGNVALPVFLLFFDRLLIAFK